MQVLQDGMQEVGLKKGEFSESLMTKMSKEPQLPLKGMIENDHFGHFAEAEKTQWHKTMRSRKRGVTQFFVGFFS